MTVTNFPNGISDETATLLAGVLTGATITSPTITGAALNLLTQTLTATGAITVAGGLVMLSHATVAIEATKAAPTAGDLLIIVNTSSGGTAAHTVTLASGVTWDGTNDVATLDAPGEALVCVATSATRFVVLVNIGTVAFS